MIPPTVPDDLKVMLKRLPVDNGQLHVCVPAGIGDNLWLWSKWWAVERNITFWLPAGEQQRSGSLFQMLGARYGYLRGLSTDVVWAQKGDPPIPDTGGILFAHPNRHLENGFRIEKWYPDLPFKNPAPPINTAVYKNVVGDSRYVVAFMCHPGYMSGNLMPGMWARIFKRIEQEIGPVLLVGADEDVPFIRQVCEIFDPMAVPVCNAPLDQVSAIIQGASAFVGVASGLSILSTYLGVPTLHAYPRHLSQMPGTWETPESIWDWSYVDELEFSLGKLHQLINRRREVPGDVLGPEARGYSEPLVDAEKVGRNGKKSSGAGDSRRLIGVGVSDGEAGVS